MARSKTTTKVNRRTDLPRQASRARTTYNDGMLAGAKIQRRKRPPLRAHRRARSTSCTTAPKTCRRQSLPSCALSKPTKRRVILLVVLEVHLGPHKYTYVHGDPIQGVDPTGLFNANTSLGGLAISTMTVGIGVAVGLSLIAASLTAQHLNDYSWAETAARDWEIRFDVIRFQRPSNPFTAGATETEFRAAFTEAAEFWERFGYDLVIRSFTTVAHEGYARMTGTSGGGGEIQDAVNEYYDGVPVLFTVWDMEGVSIKGLTSGDRQGAILAPIPCRVKGNRRKVSWQ